MIDTPAVRALVPLMKRVYDFGSVGGNLHIVLDDFNIRDDGQDSAEQLTAELACLDALAALTVDERASAIALWDGMWDEHGRTPIHGSTSVIYVRKED